MMKRTILLILVIAAVPAMIINSCRSGRIGVQTAGVDTIYTIQDREGYPVEFHFIKGSKHNYPLMALWITDTGNNYLQTLYVAESVAKGVFKHGETSTGKWMPGPIRRPAALPVWAHSRGVPEEDSLFIPTVHTPIADAYTGATPLNHFVIFSRIPDTTNHIFNVYFEINQSWDWNEYWTNNKFPDDEDYKTSCQPSLVYFTQIDVKSSQGVYDLKLIGHGHYSGDDGKIYPDLSTFTTALEITKRAYVVLKEAEGPVPLNHQ
ncbi:MAG: hypothetical protein JW723_00540 [Bacteroidales bacterium]|nr:hypothetical protein [Bacteroidales bacterium]